MSENLAYLPLVNSVEEGSLYEPHYYVFGYKDKDVSAAKMHDNYLTYGVLYNWAAAQAACPDGWRLPTDEDWKILEKNMGMTVADADDINWRNSGDVGKMLKAKKGWTLEGIGYNRIGFKALPGGYRWGDANFSLIQNKTWFWTSTFESFDNAWFRQLYYQNDGISRYYHARDHGCSVRCIKAD
jgi:uncharacterized protein (TIGR02145 family)